MSSTWTPDVWRWISDLPPVSQWNSNSTSICLCMSRSSQPSLRISITRGVQSSSSPRAFLSLVAQFRLPISLWSSSSFPVKSNEETMFHLFSEVVNGVLHYGPNKGCSLRNLSARYDDGFSDVLNLAVRTLAFLVCIYEAPGDLLRTGCLEALRRGLTTPRARETAKALARSLGAGLERKWMASINLAITNCIVGMKAPTDSFKVPSPLFSHAFSTHGLWKIQLYCPVIAMKVENAANPTHDERLLFSLRYQQVEGVIQLSHKVLFQETGIDVVVGVDNIRSTDSTIIMLQSDAAFDFNSKRCDVNPLLSNTLMAERGLGSEEKHFPSRVSVRLTPVHQSNVIAVSIRKSSGNPAREVASEKTIEGTFQPQNPYMGLSIAATETTTSIVKPWRFEQSAHGNTANLSWFLHDGADGREVSSSRTSKLQFLHHGTWFRHRYSSAYRPFTREGGVVFAGDEYGEEVCWKMSRRAAGKNLDWEIRGCIWLTYVPNKRRSHHSETRTLEFRELVQVPLAKE